MIQPFEPSHRSSPAPGARALAVPCLFAALLAIDGCGFSVFGHHFFGGPAEPTAKSAHSRHDAAPTEASAGADARAETDAHPSDPYWPYQVAQEALAHDSLSAAEEALRVSLARDSLYAPALSGLSKLLFDSGRHDEAIARLSAALASGRAYDDPTRQILLAELALHQDALGRPDLARASVAAMPDPDLKQSRSALVYVTLRGEAPDSAADLAERALGGDSRNPVHLNNYGITRLRAGDLDAAQKAFGDAIAGDPSLPGPYYNLTILEKFYRFDDANAARWFHAYWKLSHSDPDSLSGLFHHDAGGPSAREEN